jgi:protein-disulfide isomerase
MGKQAAERSRTARAAAMIEQQRRQEQRRRRTVVGAVVAVLVVLLGAGYLAMSSRDTSGAAAATPPGLTDGYAVTVGRASAPTTLTFYEDPQCPVCRDFEAQVRDDVARAVDDGRVQVEYRVVSFLDDASANEWSSRAANALMVVQAEAGPEAFAALHAILFDNQPEEGTAGPSDAQLVDWAVEAGAEESDVRAGIEGGRYDQFIVNATDQMSRDGVNGTPTVLVDGELVEGTPADAVAAVRAALA